MRHKRVPRALVIEPSLEALLALLAGEAGKPAAGHVDLDALFSIEVSLGHAFCDDLLAAFAAELPALRASHRFALAEVVSHCGRLRDDKHRGDLIGVACDESSEYVIDKRNAPADRTVICRLERGGDGRVIERLELEPFLRAASGCEGEVPLASFAATLHREPAMASAPGRVIIHKTFGRGTAFSEKGDGPTRKVTCDFPGIGLKIIQARFLTFDDEA